MTPHPPEQRSTEPGPVDQGPVELNPVEQSPADQILANQILADRFEVIADPLGWRCRACRATVSAAHDQQAVSPQAVSPQQMSAQEAVIARLAEAAADHALYCGRCED